MNHLLVLICVSGLFDDLPPSEITCRLGPQAALIATGDHNNFPDEPVVVISRRPLQFLMVCCTGETLLWQGADWSRAVPVAKVIGPGEGPDSGYAGIASVIPDHGRSLAFYHAEDHGGMGNIDVNNAPGFYASVCLARTDAGAHAERLGPVVTADTPKRTPGAGVWDTQGVGEPSVLKDATGKYLLCYYTRWTDRPRPMTYIGLARAEAKDGGRPGTWKKYGGGDFKEPGLGGKDTPLLSGQPDANVYQCQVQYVREWKRYVMLLAIGDAHDGPPAEGFYLTTSEDGIRWRKPVKLMGGCTIPQTDKRCILHPSLVLDRAGPDSIRGQLLYGFSPRWGPKMTHHLAGRSITVNLNGGREKDDRRAPKK